MEDSEQRKKRLKEMRVQADQAEVSGGIERSAMPGFLSNPLIEAPSTMPSHAAPRFDYYTDPMSAFSSNKRSTADVQVAPDHFPPPRFGGSPMAQYSSPRPESTNPQMLPPAVYGNPVWGRPRGPAHYNFSFHPSSGNTYRSPRFESSGGPIYNHAQGTTHQPSYHPNPSPGYRNSVNPSPGYRNSVNPSPGYRSNPNPSQGQGRGFQCNTSSRVSGHGSGQGQNFHGHYSSKSRAGGPDRFFKSSMVEDPWEHLEPIIWKAIGGSLNTSRMPENSKSLSTNREGSSATSVKFSSGSSLAEELAAALYEAATDAENVHQLVVSERAHHDVTKGKESPSSEKN